MMYSIKILRGFSNHREKQPAFQFLKVQAAFDREAGGRLKIISQAALILQVI